MGLSFDYLMPKLLGNRFRKFDFDASLRERRSPSTSEMLPGLPRVLALLPSGLVASFALTELGGLTATVF
jgi:hypothetical protein